jgi:glycosyltransferase involved in cell wall biosynthesis
MELKSNVEFMNFDYFDENEEDFYKKFNAKSILVQGRHWDIPPLVTIILTTYKRPKLLKQALDSALKQKGFQDYQVLVVDNEGEPLEMETDTSKLISQYNDTKIVYYRHERSLTIHKMDSAVRLARSKWICILHDDDILSENHLAVMTNLVNRNKDIKFLSCPSRQFCDELSDEEFEDLVKENLHAEYSIMKYVGHYTVLGNFPDWLGGLIDRECYISIGGMPTIVTGVGDAVMVRKFIYRYGVYQCLSDSKLYHYRGWSGQISSGGSNKWGQCYINEYRTLQYANRKYRRFPIKLWDRISAIVILNKCEVRNNGYYDLNIDLKEIIRVAQMPRDILSNKIRHKMELTLLYLYDWLMKKYIGYCESHNSIRL